MLLGKKSYTKSRKIRSKSVPPPTIGTKRSCVHDIAACDILSLGK